MGFSHHRKDRYEAVIRLSIYSALLKLCTQAELRIHTVLYPRQQTDSVGIKPSGHLNVFTIRYMETNFLGHGKKYHELL